MQLGFLPTCLIAALIPLLVGFIYYNPKVMGNAWMKETGLNEEQLKIRRNYRHIHVNLLF